MLGEDLNRRETLKDAFKLHNIVVQKDDDSDQEFETRLLKEAHKVILTSPTSKKMMRQSGGNKAGVNWNPNWEIKYQGVGREKTRAAIICAVDRSTENVRTYLTESFSRLIELRKLQKLEDLEKRISITKSEYGIYTRRYIALLDEQSEIARAQGIDQGTLEARSINTSQALIAGPESGGPLYLRGFKALDKELGLVRSRTNELDFIPNYAPLEVARLTVKQDRLTDRLVNAFENTPIAKGPFVAATYSKFAIKFKQSFGKFEVLVVFLFIGALIGVGTVVMRQILKTETRLGSV